MIVSAISLSEAAEEEGLDLENVVALKRYLTKKVEELIEKAMADWETRRKEAIIVDRAIAPSEEYVKKMLPLVRLKVCPFPLFLDWTFIVVRSILRVHLSCLTPSALASSSLIVSQIQEMFSFFTVHRDECRKNLRQIELKVRVNILLHSIFSDPLCLAAIQESLDDPGLSTSEKLERVRVQNLVREYLAAQELQLLNEAGLSDAIGAFVEKDDGHSISLSILHLFGDIALITSSGLLSHRSSP